MIITIHILVQTTSSKLTSMNNIKEKKNQFSSLHRSITMISYVKSFIYIHIFSYTENIVLHRHPACDLSPIIIFLFFSLVLSFSFTLCHSLSRYPTIAVQNSTYPVLVGDYNKHLNTHTRRYFFSSKISFLYVALLKHQCVCVLSNQVLFEN
jgi:hypothetical protein